MALLAGNSFICTTSGPLGKHWAFDSQQSAAPLRAGRFPKA